MPNIVSCATGVRLREVLPEATFFGADDIVVQACASHSRAVSEGDLFVALIGSDVDGHDYVGQAIQRGATAALVEYYVPTRNVPLCIVPDSRAAFGRVCQALAGDPSRRLNTIGVTGTNGKTSTAWLIASVLEAAGCRAGLTGTIVNSDGQAAEPSDMTTPPPPQLADWLWRMTAAGCSHAVVEVSSHALAQSRLAGMELAGACVTNVLHDHLDFHNSIENYREAKARIFSYLGSGGFAVLNADDPVSSGFVSRVPGPALTIGIHNEANLTANVLERCPSEQTFLLQAGSETAAVRTRIIGDQHIYNCLTAAAIGLLNGIDLPQIVRGLEKLEKIPGRMERIECGQEFAVFVDYAHTPDALRAVLRAARGVAAGRVICVFGAGGDRDRCKRPLMARAVEEIADVVVLTDDNPRDEDPDRIRDDILRGFGSLESVIVKPDRSEAIHWALQRATPGDCVLIAGKGHEDYQIVGNARRWFDDREIARRWLYENAPAARHSWLPRANAG